MVLVSEGMSDRERYLHEKYRIPATVDLSDEATAYTQARLNAQVAVKIAEATEAADDWLAAQGKAPSPVSPSSSAVPKEVVDYARALCDELEHQTSPGYFIHGLSGRGKTAIADHVLHWWQLDGRQGDRVAEKQYLDALKASFSGASDEFDVKRRYGNAALLVLDDLGAAKSSDWALSEIEWLIDWRWTNGLPTVITSNYDVSRLREKWAAVDPVQADRAASRITGMCKDVHLTGPDHRPAVRVVPTEPGRHQENPYQ